MSFFISIHDLDLRDSSNLRASTGVSFCTVCSCLINGACSLGPSSVSCFMHLPVLRSSQPGMLFSGLLTVHLLSLIPDSVLSSWMFPKILTPGYLPHGETPLSVAASDCMVSPNHTRFIRMPKVMTPHRPKLRRKFITHVIMLARETWADTLAGHLTEWREWWVTVFF